MTKAFLFIFGLLVASSVPTFAMQPELALSNVDVIDVETGQILDDRTILIDGDTIGEILPPDASFDAGSVVDAQGTWAIPGLWDMHFHISKDRISREVIFPLAIAHGVTGVRVMNGSCLADCNEYDVPHAVIEGWKGDQDRGALLAPQLVVGSAIVHGETDPARSSVLRPRTFEEGRALVTLYDEAGVDFIKTYTGIPHEALRGVATEAARRGLPFVGHTALRMRTAEFSDLGATSIEHGFESHLIMACSNNETALLEQLAVNAEAGRPLADVFLAAMNTYDDKPCRDAFQTLAANGTWWTPTLYVAGLFAKPDGSWKKHQLLRFLPAFERNYWAQSEVSDREVMGPAQAFVPLNAHLSKLIAQARAAGVGLLAGSDAGVVNTFWGDALHEELAILVDADLTPLEALQAATLSPARYLGREGQSGTIAPGQRADIVLLTANPLEDIRNTRRIEGVMVAGTYLARHDIDRMLEQIAATIPELNTTEVAKTR